MPMFTKKIIIDGKEMTIVDSNEEDLERKAKKLEIDWPTIQAREEAMKQAMVSKEKDDNDFQERMRMIPKPKLFFFNYDRSDKKKEESIEEEIKDWMFNIYNDNVEILDIKQNYLLKDSQHYILMTIWYKERLPESKKEYTIAPTK